MTSLTDPDKGHSAGGAFGEWITRPTRQTDEWDRLMTSVRPCALWSALVCFTLAVIASGFEGLPPFAVFRLALPALFDPSLSHIHGTASTTPAGEQASVNLTMANSHSHMSAQAVVAFTFSLLIETAPASPGRSWPLFIWYLASMSTWLYAWSHLYGAVWLDPGERRFTLQLYGVAALCFIHALAFCAIFSTPSRRSFISWLFFVILFLLWIIDIARHIALVSTHDANAGKTFIECAELYLFGRWKIKRPAPAQQAGRTEDVSGKSHEAVSPQMVKECVEKEVRSQLGAEKPATSQQFENFEAWARGEIDKLHKKSDWATQQIERLPKISLDALGSYVPAPLRSILHLDPSEPTAEPS
ncbi:uncharacterized protein JCM10292_001897 [Rhodotorula paludigena]|uniref:uncharacterized protein n=1 Tax=Rhodotorula paludigena TaxID=86838 RepID=UPI0031818519